MSSKTALELKVIRVGMIIGDLRGYLIADHEKTGLMRRDGCFQMQIFERF
jgi:hypothetical protein